MTHRLWATRPNGENQVRPVGLGPDAIQFPQSRICWVISSNASILQCTEWCNLFRPKVAGRMSVDAPEVRHTKCIDSPWSCSGASSTSELRQHNVLAKFRLALAI